MNASAVPMPSPVQVLAYLRPRLVDEQTVEQTHATLVELGAESGWLHLGGSGARIRVYRLDGGLRVAVQFDGTDRLRAYAVYLDGRPWATDAAGMLVAAFPEAAVSWIFLGDVPPAQPREEP